jgi:hypothetical protein
LAMFTCTFILLLSCCAMNRRVCVKVLVMLKRNAQ